MRGGIEFDGSGSTSRRIHMIHTDTVFRWEGLECDPCPVMLLGIGAFGRTERTETEDLPFPAPELNCICKDKQTKETNVAQISYIAIPPPLDHPLSA